MSTPVKPLGNGRVFDLSAENMFADNMSRWVVKCFWCTALQRVRLITVAAKPSGRLSNLQSAHGNRSDAPLTDA